MAEITLRDRVSTEGVALKRQDSEIGKKMEDKSVFSDERVQKAGEQRRKSR